MSQVLLTCYRIQYCHYCPGKSLQHWIEHLWSFRTTLSQPCSRPWPLHNSVPLRRVIPYSCLRWHNHISLFCRGTGNLTSVPPRIVLVEWNVLLFQPKLQAAQQRGWKSRLWNKADSSWNISCCTDDSHNLGRKLLIFSLSSCRLKAT